MATGDAANFEAGKSATAADIVALKKKLRDDVARRAYTGAINNQADSYNFTTTPASGGSILIDHQNKIANQMKLINDSYVTAASQGNTISLSTAATYINTWAGYTFGQGNATGCKSSCTGMCNTTCSSSCARGCSSGCSSGSACSGSCLTTCALGCASTCSTECDQANCKGTCVKACQDTCNSVCSYTSACKHTCTRDCSVTCSDVCDRNNCKNGCLGSCTGGCQKLSN